MLAGIGVNPEGQEKLTLPQVALTVRGHTHKDFTSCPLSLLIRWARPLSAERSTAKHQKEIKEDYERKKAARTESC